MPTMHFERIDWPTLAALRNAWEAELRRRGLSSEARIWSIAMGKARRGKMPKAAR